MPFRTSQGRRTRISVNSLTFRVGLASLQAKPLLGRYGTDLEQLNSKQTWEQTLSNEAASRATGAERLSTVGARHLSARSARRVRLWDASTQPASGAIHARGPLAQLAEQLTLNQQVRGSSPWRLTSYISTSGLPQIPRLSREDTGSPAFLSSSGEVSELADEHDLGSCAARRRSSSLLFPTNARPTTNRSVVLRTLEPQASLKECSYG